MSSTVTMTAGTAYVSSVSTTEATISSSKQSLLGGLKSIPVSAVPNTSPTQYSGTSGGYTVTYPNENGGTGSLTQSSSTGAPDATLETFTVDGTFPEPPDEA